MQTITRELPNIHPLFDEIDKIYAELSEHSRPKKLIQATYSDVFNPLIDIFKKYGYEGDIHTQKRSLPPLNTPVNDKKGILVCFSSGKDSIATVKHYMKEGYDVSLYHLRNINPPLHDEVIQAQELAKYWDIPIYVDTIRLSGMHEYVEHPMKNMIIANGALQRAIKENIPQVAFGNYRTSSLEYDNFEFCGGDDMEMWDIYNQIISSVWPGFKMQIVLSNLSETLDTVCADKDLMDMSVSCLGRASMRQYWHDWVLSKYGVNIPKHRCGRCYKCCIEYIYMVDHDLQEYNEEYYKYCLKNLKKNVQREDGVKYSDERVWAHYFFYDIERSKYYG